VAAAGFCSLVNLYAPQAILPTLAEKFHASPAAVASTISATTLAVAVCAPFAGVLADRWGRKRVMLLGLVGLAVPTVLSALASTLLQLIATRFLQGIFVPAVFTAALGFVSEEWDRATVGRAMSLYVSANVLGGFFGRMAIGLAADYANWQWGFMLLGVLNLAGAGLVWRCLPPPRKVARREGDARASAPMLRGMAAHLRNRRLLSAYLVGFDVLFCLVTVFTYMNFHLAAPPFGLSPAALGLVFCVYLVGSAVTPFSGRWIDRLGQRRVVLLAVGAAALGALATLPAWLPSFVFGLCLFCSASFVSHAAATSYVGLAAGAQRSSAAGLYLSFYYGGGAVGAVLPGLAWSQFGWPGCVALVVGMQAAVAIVAARLWR
jgi:predicted MFS family arabinose efflux permease